MSEWVAVAPEADFPPGKRYKVPGREADIVVLHVGDDYYAVTDVCPHRGGPVGEGPLYGTVIECPLHQWRFHLETGAEVRNPVARIPVHDVKVEDGVVYVDREPRAT